MGGRFNHDAAIALTAGSWRLISQNLDTGADAPELHRSILSMLTAANAYQAPSSLRRYQAEIARSGKFVLVDPRDGQPVRCVASLYHRPKSFSYLFEGAQGPFWVMTSLIANAYALSAVYFPPDGLCLVHTPGLEPSHLTLRAELIAASTPNSSASPEAVIVVGHQNFAHFAWNELSALLQLQQGGPVQPGPLCVIAEPILPIEDLIDISGRQITRIAEKELHPNQPQIHDRVLYCPGSELLTEPVKDVVGRLCAKRRPICLAADPADVFTVWISLRLLYRRGVNEREAFVAVMRRLLAESADFRFVLDGYSLPSDLYAPGRHDVPNERERQAEVSTVATSLISEFGASERARIYDITGADLPSALAVAAHADFYICHHGTQQHKIGWFYAVPGLIHAGRSVVETQPAGWVKAQSQGAILPHYVPLDLVGDCESPDNPRQSMPYFADYAFTSAERFADLAIELVLAEHQRWKVRKGAPLPADHGRKPSKPVIAIRAPQVLPRRRRTALMQPAAGCGSS